VEPLAFRPDVSSPYPDYTGKPCPKCGYVRAATATNPPWQCPRCLIAYHKFLAAQSGLAARVAAGGRELAGRAVADNSVWSLLAANLFAIVVTLATHMTLRELLLVYWVQNVVIGASFFIRILSLENFSTEGFTINERPVEETPASKRKVALFFAVHFGLFHFVYLMFLAAGGTRDGAAPDFGLDFWVCVLAFVVNHVYSLRENVRNDRRGRPNLGTLMFLPYARVVPMHLAIILGGAPFMAGTTLLLFMALKVGADVTMHTVEHHTLQKAAA
jgi:hypothetical protein